jgi:hypothetical protein
MRTTSSPTRGAAALTPPAAKAARQGIDERRIEAVSRATIGNSDRQVDRR